MSLSAQSAVDLSNQLEDSKKVMALLISGLVDFHALGMRLAQEHPGLFLELSGLPVNHLGGLYQVVEGTKKSWFFNGVSLMDMAPEDLAIGLDCLSQNQDQIVSLLMPHGQIPQKVQAIKLTREILGCGLKEAKTFIDWIQEKLSELGVL